MSYVSGLGLKLVHLIKPQRIVFEQIAEKLTKLAAAYRLSFSVHGQVVAAPGINPLDSARQLEKAIKAAKPFISYRSLRENLAEPKNLLPTLDHLARALDAVPAERLEGEKLDLLILHQIRLRATSNYHLSDKEKQEISAKVLNGMLGLVFCRPGPERAEIELTAVNKRNIWLAFKYYSTLNWPEDWGQPDIIVNADGLGAIKARRVLIHELAELDKLAEIFRDERPQLEAKFPETMRPFAKQKDLKMIVESEVGRESERHALLDKLFDDFPEAHQHALTKEAEYVAALASDCGLNIPVETIRPVIAKGKLILMPDLMPEQREFFELLELVEKNYTGSYASAVYDSKPYQFS
jgi:hypothetical protein